MTEITGQPQGIDFKVIQNEATEAGTTDGQDNILTQDEFLAAAIAMNIPQDRATDIWATNFGDSESIDEETFSSSDASQTLQQAANLFSPEKLEGLIDILTQFVNSPPPSQEAREMYKGDLELSED